MTNAAWTLIGAVAGFVSLAAWCWQILEHAQRQRTDDQRRGELRNLRRPRLTEEQIIERGERRNP